MNIIRDYIKHQGNLLICLSGLSGAGKTYNAKKLSKQLGLVYIDQDQFYKNPYDMPSVALSNGDVVTNWDCQEAIDLDKMNQIINENIGKGLIMSGFACRNDWFDQPINCQIHLNINKTTCYQRRKEQFKDPIHQSEMIIDELVYPFYLKTLQQSQIDFTIDSNQKTNQTLDLLSNYISQHLHSHLKNKIMSNEI